MPIPTLEQLMSTSISELAEWDLLDVGPYFGVITGSEARSGKKGPFVNLEITLHSNAEGDETMKGRKVWRNVSFSEASIAMPGGLAQLVQCAQPDIPESSDDDLPAALSQVLVGLPIGVELTHEQGWDSKRSKKAVDENGNPIMREAVDSFFQAPESFADGIEAESVGNDLDLPF